MAKNIVNYLGFKLIKPLLFQILTQLPVGVFVFFLFLHCARICFLSLQFWILSAFLYRSWMMHQTALSLVVPWRSPSPFVSALPDKPGLGLRCINSQANCTSQSCLNTSRDDKKLFRTISPVPNMRLVTTTNKTCTVVWNEGPTSLPCAHSHPWRNMWNSLLWNWHRRGVSAASICLLTGAGLVPQEEHEDPRLGTPALCLLHQWPWGAGTQLPKM